MPAFISKVTGLGGFIFQVGIAGFHHNAVVAAAATATTATAARERPVCAASMTFFLLITTISRCLHTLHWWQKNGPPWPSIILGR